MVSLIVLENRRIVTRPKKHDLRTDSKANKAKTHPLKLPLFKIGSTSQKSHHHEAYLFQTTNSNQNTQLTLFSYDHKLLNHKTHLEYRWHLLQDTLKNIKKHEFSLKNFSSGHLHYNVHQEENCSVFREWAPAATNAMLIGDFNKWRGTYMTKDTNGVWTCRIPHKEGRHGIYHKSRLKIRLQHKGGWWIDVLPAYTTYAIQKTDKFDGTFDAIYWNPPINEKYIWKHKRPKLKGSLKIYEAHIGMSSKKPKVSTYKEFTEEVIPRIVEQGYNAIQLMAIQEHPYYGSFGYHVSNIYAVSSRFGTPEEFKCLIDTAHGSGLIVLLDIVHSHVSKNVRDGLSGFDFGQGPDENYFHTGSRGYHKLWDSRLFNYKNWEVLRLLLSNLRWWIEEYHFDGFRFDGVTSMLYHHHGINFEFSGNYTEYFSTMTDVDAIVYLMLSNILVHEILPGAITIAEDVSGMPTLCLPIEVGGIGFDYRLAMGIPELWLKIVNIQKDKNWSMSEILKSLTNRHKHEKTISYVECHDQCMVGGQTLAFRLMGSEMWDHMSTLNGQKVPLIDRGIALHKMIRLVTFVLGGQAWLNFMGNEFGHPDWVDFPRFIIFELCKYLIDKWLFYCREGNNWSYDKCRRQWDLVDIKGLKYRHLNQWDHDMLALDEMFDLIQNPDCNVTMISDILQIIVIEKSELIFVFNFSPNNNYCNFKVTCILLT